MASYKLTIVLENEKYADAFRISVNGSSITPSNTSETVEAGSTLSVECAYGKVYLNGTDTGGRTYTYTVNSDVTVTLTASDYSAYIVEESGNSGGDTGGSGGGHKALIGGTAYGISGGRAMVGGTVYNISNGKVLVDGTVFELAFGPGSFTVSITGSGVVGEIILAKVSIDGNDYADAATVTVEAGTEVVFTVTGTAYGETNYIYLDGDVVARAGKYETGTYTMAVGKNISVKLTVQNSNILTSLYATIEITTE